MAIYTGIVKVKIGGELLETLEGATLNVGGKERTEQIVNGEVKGHFKSAVASVITANIGHQAITNIETLRGFEEGLAEFVTDTGITFQIPNAFTATALELSGGGEGIAIEIRGGEAIPL